MTFLPLTLGVGVLSGTEKVGASSTDKTKIEKTLKRDSNACRFCGFVSEKFQRVVENPDAAHADKLLTTCTFCEMVLYPERNAVAGAGVLVWLPEITQVDLNHIMRAIYVAREGEGAIAEAAAKALDLIMARRTDAKKRLGTDDPVNLAAVLGESLDKAEAKKALAKLDGVRLVPSDKYIIRSANGVVNQFPKMLSYWLQSKNGSGLVSPDIWGDLYKQVKSAA